MKRFLQSHYSFFLFVFFILSPMLFSSCEKAFFKEIPEDSPASVFVQIWEFADEQYSFFEYKQIDWDSVYTVYSSRVSDDMNSEELFRLMANMLYLLKDGHVNLHSDFDFSRNWDWYLEYPQNYNKTLLERYYYQGLQQYAGPFILVDFEDVGYIHYTSFSNTISVDNMNYVFQKFKDHKGLIIDVRNNGGGALSNAYMLANSFVTEKTVVARNRYKNGPGHDDFSEMYDISLTPPDGAESFDKPVVILTNRSCYSATNFFLTFMKGLPGVTLVGDKSGGGGGIPTFTELTNGWTVRVSSTQTFTLEGINTEGGIEPDVKIDLLESDENNNRDTLLEYALNSIRNS